MSLVLASPAFGHQQFIPSTYTCEGSNISPPLVWAPPPSACKSIVLIVDDPDAPDPAAPKMTFVHWILYNLPPVAGQLVEGISDDQLPKGTRVGINDRQVARYTGPCPPIGTHRYFHKLYALDITLPEMGNVTKPELLEAMQGHILAQSELIGLYIRKTTG
ncbi:MAG: YbhB/YbcL family Raf kinase inhibitor-like protein [Burkholderiaceae bacterium]|jgi:Raf kinase inhibitor-like YbhB/YbcL family protein|nr:YbhB/YbcL family Raf kinase inhibitor-like protein [Burkholderiaceae bacterium]